MNDDTRQLDATLIVFDKCDKGSQFHPLAFERSFVMNSQVQLICNFNTKELPIFLGFQMDG